MCDPIERAAAQHEVRSPSNSVLLHCDQPDLPPGKVSIIAPSFMLNGWALSDHGIKEVEVYLDEQSLGTAIYGGSRPDVGAAYPQFPGSRNSGFLKLVNIAEAGKGSRKLRIVAQGYDQSTVALERLVQVEKDVPAETPLNEGLQYSSVGEGATTSVVIITKSPPREFEQTLQRLIHQRLSSPPEIVVINSGTEPLQEVSKMHGVKVFNMHSPEYHVGQALNYGADQTTGQYLFFIADDAIAASNHLFSEMIEVLEENPKVACVTARQIPRSDADFMACQAIWRFYSSLGHGRDRAVVSSDLDLITSSHDHGVCSCFRKDVFLKYKYMDELDCAVGLDLEIRLVKDAYEIAHLLSTGVIHSHTRPPRYYLKRGYTHIKTLSRLLNHNSSAIGNHWTLPAVIELVLQSHDALCSAIDHLEKSKFYDGDISKVLSDIVRRMREPELGAQLAQDVDLSGFLDEIAEAIGHRRSSDKAAGNVLTEKYLASMRRFEEWLLNTRPNLDSKEEEFTETSYKILAEEIGRFLGEYHASSRGKGVADPKLAKLDELMSQEYS